MKYKLLKDIANCKAWTIFEYNKNIFNSELFKKNFSIYNLILIIWIENKDFFKEIKQENTTDLEKFKKICNEIGFELFFVNNENLSLGMYTDSINQTYSVKEIIFTQEFIDQYTLYIANKEKTHNKENWALYLLDHLDKPIEYLYNVLFD